MGISRLNFFLKTACKSSITQISLRKLYGKSISVDTSIYLYKFKADGALIDNFYKMCCLFKQHNITPIFVFDGKPPPEKNKTLSIRKEKKEKAESEYNQFKAKLEKNPTRRERRQIIIKMNQLKRKFIRIKNKEIRKVKELFKSYGISYVEAPEEADKLCVKLVLENEAFACLSEDMDMFAYGCPYVLRYLNLITGNVVLYNLANILTQLSLSMKEFRSICILAGTDYFKNSNRRPKTTYYYYRLFQRFQKTDQTDFFRWLEDNKVLQQNYDILLKTTSLFDLSDMPFSNNIIIKNEINMSALREILKSENFIFSP